MKKILIFSTAYHPFIGGAEVAVKEITVRLGGGEFSAKGGPAFGWDMLTARMDRKLPKFEKIGNVNVYRIGIGWPMFDKYLLAFCGHRFAQKLRVKNDYNFIWSVMASYGGFAAMFFKKKNPRTPFLLTLQEGDSSEYIKKRAGFLGKWFKRIFMSADYIQCISNFLADWAKEMGAKCPIEVVPNGVDINKFKVQSSKFKVKELKQKLEIKEDEKIIITTSRLVEKNGVGDLIDAVGILVKDYKMPIKLLICGTGPLKEKLKFQVSSFKFQDKVLFLGQVSHNDLPRYLWISDVFCRPSLSEGLGNSFLEAMAAGVPVVATPVGGIPDFLKNGETGLFCEVNNPRSVAEKINYILDEKNKEEINRVVANAKKMVEEKYNWDNIAVKMNNMFNKFPPKADQPLAEINQ